MNVRHVLILLATIIGCENAPSHKQATATRPASRPSGVLPRTAEQAAHEFFSASSSQPISRPTSRRVTDFPLRPDVTLEQFLKAVGGPDRVAGSGLLYYVYELGDGRELRVLFFEEEETQEPTVWRAFIVDEQGKTHWLLQ